MYNYLVNTPGPFTQETLKAFKSLDGYNYFVSGHVRELLTKKVAGDKLVLLKTKGKVTPGQRLNDPPHECWVAADPDGTIIRAHCTCTAG